MVPPDDTPRLFLPDGGPGPTPQRVPIIAAPPVGGKKLLCLSDMPVAVYTHYDLEIVTSKGRGRTVPCIGATCPYCLRLPPMHRRWKAFVSCWEPLLGRLCLAEITAQAARDANSWLWNTPLRGRWIHLCRVSNHGQAVARVDLAIAEKGPDPLPDPLNVLDCLKRIWGVDY